MSISSMSVWELLVPTLIDEKPVRTRRHRVWDAKVRAITGGLTIMPPVRGQWVAPDKTVFLERMIPVRVACTKEQIDVVVDMTAQFYNQQAIMYYCISEEVYIKEFK